LNDFVPPSLLTTTSSDDSALARQHLAKLLARHAPHDGFHDLPLPGVHIYRMSQIDSLPTRTISKPGMCIIAQGAKRTVIGDDVYEYDNSRMAVYAAEVPFSAKIIKASAEEPYLCLVIDIEAPKLAELVLKAFPHGLPRPDKPRPLYLGRANPKIVEASCRLFDLLEQPNESDLLLPLLIEEIFIRLLRSDIGVMVAQVSAIDSSMQKVSKAIKWIRENYKESLKVNDLAGISNMSISSFHTYFKSVTSMSPIQFQKELRLHEARQLMFSELMDVSTASIHVGYSSISQFSREYSRLFGVSPSKDTKLNAARQTS
jgi:AraC-like DNA-binding protein